MLYRVWWQQPTITCRDCPGLQGKRVDDNLMGFKTKSSQEYNYVNSVKRWLFTTNHKDIGILYLVTSLVVFFIAGSLALMMRTQLFYPENTFLSSYYYNQFESGIQLR